MIPDVSIIIVSWNTCDVLRDCLHSIADQTTRAHEVIVVDNNSNDGTAEMVSREFPTVILIANDANRGFAAANNQGIRMPKVDICCCSIRIQLFSIRQSIRWSIGVIGIRILGAPAAKCCKQRIQFSVRASQTLVRSICY